MNSPVTQNIGSWSEREQLDFLGSEEFAGMLAQVVAPLGLQHAVVRVAELHHRPGAGVSGVFEATDGTTSMYLGATAEKLKNVDRKSVV